MSSKLPTGFDFISERSNLGNSETKLLFSENGQRYIPYTGKSEGCVLVWSVAVRKIRDVFVSSFLPVGWPYSVTSDYLRYQMYDSLQGLCSYIRGMLTSHAMLVGVGVGSSTATPAAAALQLFFRDAIGQVSGLLFVSSQGNMFDAYAKQWRLVADISNDVGMFFEIIVLLFPRYFLVLACLAAICRSVTGGAGGATRAALTQHFAREGNHADISAKEGSQETLMTILGMLFGTFVVKAVPKIPFVIWISFILLTVLHVWFNVLAMRSLCIKRINTHRLELLLEEFVSRGQWIETLPKPSDISKMESLFPPIICVWIQRIMMKKKRMPRVHLAPSLSKVPVAVRVALASRIKSHNNHKYIQKQYWVIVDSDNLDVYVFLHVSAKTHEDYLKACCCGLYASLDLKNMKGTRVDHAVVSHNRNIAEFPVNQKPSDAVVKTNKWVDGGGMDQFISTLERSGWDLSNPALSMGSARISAEHVSSVESLSSSKCMKSD